MANPEAPLTSASAADPPSDGPHPSDASEPDTASSTDPALESIPPAPADDRKSDAVPEPNDRSEAQEAPASERAASPSPAPAADERRRARAAFLGSCARTVTLGALLTISVVVWAELTFKGTWVSSFLVSNDLEMPQRMRFLASIVLSGVLGAALSAAGIVFARRKAALAPQVLEGWLWFASPLILLPVFPQFFRYKAWQERHEDLLTAVLVVGVIAEVLLVRSFASVPAAVGRAWQRLKEHVERLPSFARKHAPLFVVAGAALFYAVFFSYWTVSQHQQLRTHTFDLSINNNLLFGGLHGIFMESPIAFPSDPGKYLGAHVKWGGYLFLPIYALHPEAETLLVIQSTVLGLGALPLFGFARRHVSDWVAAIVALVYLCYYPMHSANFFEVKYVPIAAPFIIATVWAAETRRWVWFGFLFVATLLMREDVPIGLAVIGTFLLLTGHRPVAGLIMAAVSTVWFLYLRFYLMDTITEWWFPKMYKDLWSPGEEGFGSVLKTLLSNPIFTLKHIVTETKIVYLAHLLVPILLLPARRWYLWAAFIPGTILTLLATDYKPITMFSFQYVMNWTPYIFLAVPLALAAITRDAGHLRARAALTAVALASAALTYNYGAFAARPKSVKSGYIWVDFDESEHDKQRYAQVLELKKLVPREASIATTENIGPHFSSRVKFYSLRRGYHGAEYIVAERNKLGLEKTEKYFKQAVMSGKYGVVKLFDDMVLLKKGHDGKLNEQLIAEWKL